MSPQYNTDFIVFSPNDVDLTRSPLRASLTEETFVLGAFNPGMTRLPGGNLLMMVRIAESLRQPIRNDQIHSIRWDPQFGWQLDAYPLAQINASDPRKFQLLGYQSKVMALTSFSWILPVELTPDGREIVEVHYQSALVPERTYQEYGIEDARISKVGDTYYLTTCCVSAERHSTVLYTSTDGINYQLEGMVLDHQNKDMLIFEGKPMGKFHALTRPQGEVYFAYPPASPYVPGPSINLATSSDCLSWRPVDKPLLRGRKGSTSSMKIGGGSQPIETEQGWLVLYHGVESTSLVGVYRTFWALLDKNDPSNVLHLEDKYPLLEARPDLVAPFKDQIYLTGVVFTTGIVDSGDHYIVASGEVDLACRITAIPKSVFADPLP